VEQEEQAVLVVPEVQLRHEHQVRHVPTAIPIATVEGREVPGQPVVPVAMEVVVLLVLALP
jgi:hypothetical protein